MEQTTPSAVNIAELLESVLVLFKGKLALGKISLRLEKRDSPHLICYPGEIRQVVANLIRNAVEAMPDGGILRVRVQSSTHWRSDSKGVRVTIADTGQGMSPAIRKRIYSPFFTTKGDRGNGLGLWVATGIMLKHRGRMHLRSSERRGKSGTAFTLVFPCIGAQGLAGGLGDIDAGLGDTNDDARRPPLQPKNQSPSA